MKIDKIEIQNFRAFPLTSEAFTFPLEGNNLLVYGENGSGKSSLYRALREYFELDPYAKDFAKFVHVFTGDEKKPVGKVKLTLSNGGEHSWDPALSGHRAKDNPGILDADYETLVEGSRRAGFLDYRSMLEMSHGSATNAERLFNLCVSSILSGVELPPAASADSIGDLWSDLNESSIALPMSVTEGDTKDLQGKLNEFNLHFAETVHAIEHGTEELLRNFLGSNLDLRLNFSPLVYVHHRNRNSRVFSNSAPNDGHRPELHATVRYGGRTLNDWEDFLNEARLSALALSLFLAGVLTSNPAPVAGKTPLKLLVLDDVLIGFDMQHRMPILEVLDNHFRDFQVILLTHDKVWYELAKLSIEHLGTWMHGILYCKPEVNENGEQFEAPVGIFWPKPDSPEDFLVRADERLKANDERTAGFFARVALEAKLKKACNKHGVPIPYSITGKNLTTNHFLEALKTFFRRKGIKAKALFSIQRVEMFRSGVLNPMAHYDPTNLAPNEVQMAIDAVRELKLDDGKKQHDISKSEYTLDAKTLFATASLSDQQRIEGVCLLRTCFEFDLVELCKRVKVKVPYSPDISNLPFTDLWTHAKTELTTVNLAQATALIGNVEGNKEVFLDDWDFKRVRNLSEVAVRQAWDAIKDSSKNDEKTLLATF